MDPVIPILVVSFFALLLINTPVCVAIALASFAAILSMSGDASLMVAQRMANGTDSFPLLAIPFFVFAGYLMGRGGLARRLIDFAQHYMGRLPGGLAYANTLTCMLFGSISGSAAAAVSSIGGFMIPEMNKKGYDRDFNVALTATAATTGLLIPPSNCMIVYSVAAGSVSIAAMFLAGILPGILVGVCIMVAAGIVSWRRGYGRGAAPALAPLPGRVKGALWALRALCLAALAAGWAWKGFAFGLQIAVGAIILTKALAPSSSSSSSSAASSRASSPPPKPLPSPSPTPSSSPSSAIAKSPSRICRTSACRRASPPPSSCSWSAPPAP